MQVSYIYVYSVIFDKKTKVIEGRQKELEKQLSIYMMRLKN